MSIGSASGTLLPLQPASPHAKTRPNVGDAFSKSANWAGTLRSGSDVGSSRQLIA